jgi:hypothetical protein
MKIRSGLAPVVARHWPLSFFLTPPAPLLELEMWKEHAASPEEFKAVDGEQMNLHTTRRDMHYYYT